MEPVLRPARPDDKAAIVAFTRDTWDWGDYLEQVFDRWLAAPDSLGLIAEVAGEPVGYARGSLLSPTEAWAQGLRVRPDHRRRGLATALMEGLADWARAAGARVMRLSIWEDHVLQVFSPLGFRPGGGFLAAERPVASPGTRPQGNGGKRVPAAERLVASPFYEAPAAMLAWSGSALEKEAHGLFTQDWVARLLTLADLEAAARDRTLWQTRSGWALAQASEGVLRVSWLCTYPEDARLMLRALVDLAAAQETTSIEMPIPAVDWLQAALEQAGWDLHPLRVLARLL